MIHGGEIYDKTVEYDFSVNLNPTPCPKDVKDALIDSISEVDRYPDISQQRFREYVARAENKLAGKDYLTKDNVIGGNGASELFMSIIRLIAPKNVLLPIPSFFGYRHALNALDGVKIHEYLCKEDNDFCITDDIISEITENTDLILLANPNNPTGRAVDRNVLKHIIDRCKETDTWIIIDECFLHLTDGAESALKYIGDTPKLFIVNAYTKLFSLPGIRVGYAMADSKNISKLQRFLPEWNMSVFAQNTGYACAKCILETDFVENTKNTVKELCTKLSELLAECGFRVLRSDTCFVLIESKADLYSLFLDKKILIRDCSNFIGLGKGYFRISVSGYHRLCELKEYINSNKDRI
ncbi:pyridoxal phosphate-dependent aminotransferase [Butyrivibrio sp. YAB3001]|uniref:pyridoxal phosphate-dependent aminotransferase n=1 Tax=Butyrivibrio sp. YAB3001 TaxID=1520812 RepID=UPI0008F64881|nr:histidinol-phosphate transaminase [Butyrivibrio sp. YAB3001]SFC55202.1 Histidinol-phosphate/aromatic aminotransferase or cobyric acid decarboxylase [Butyrivibrio sp. YAB3001]